MECYRIAVERCSYITTKPAATEYNFRERHMLVLIADFLEYTWTTEESQRLVKVLNFRTFQYKGCYTWSSVVPVYQSWCSTVGVQLKCFISDTKRIDIQPTYTLNTLKTSYLYPSCHNRVHEVEYKYNIAFSWIPENRTYSCPFKAPLCGAQHVCNERIGIKAQVWDTRCGTVTMFFMWRPMWLWDIICFVRDSVTKFGMFGHLCGQIFSLSVSLLVIVTILTKAHLGKLVALHVQTPWLPGKPV